MKITNYTIKAITRRSHCVEARVLKVLNTTFA